MNRRLPCGEPKWPEPQQRPREDDRRAIGLLLLLTSGIAVICLVAALIHWLVT